MRSFEMDIYWQMKTHIVSWRFRSAKKKFLVYTVSLEDVDRKPLHAWTLGSPQKYIVLASEISEEMIFTLHVATVFVDPGV